MPLKKDLQVSDDSILALVKKTAETNGAKQEFYLPSLFPASRGSDSEESKPDESAGGRMPAADGAADGADGAEELDSEEEEERKREKLRKKQ